jgi:hypothetical protein
LQLAGCSSSDGATLQTQVPDTLNRTDFIELAGHYLAEMKTHRAISNEECITMVRLFNTIETSFPNSTEEPLKSYRDVFWNDYLTKCVSQLNAKLTKGMGYYAKEFDLYIGGPDAASSRFVVM